MSKPVYLTTPLYYVNASPHIGHSYTEVAADCLARFHRLRGDDVFFLTGTDEHGEKIAQAAAAKQLSPKAFADRTAEQFKALWTRLGIAYDRFIRTTDPDHEAVVQRVLTALKPQLILGTYAFWYCVPCETNFGEAEVDAASPLCLNCRRPLQRVEEQDYFLKLDEHRAWLRQHIENHPDFIRPPERRNEVLALLRDGAPPLPDLCLTRPKERVPWGIAVPFSPAHTTYVWFDALVNYVSALGWPDSPNVARYWHEAGAVHLIGKDILRHHALYWPIILHALGLRPPKTVFAHGFWKMGEQKMSKSLGNIIDPVVVIEHLLKDQLFGADAYRYFLLREVPFGQDGAFSEEALLTRLNTDLANDLGNLVNRACSMIGRYCGGAIPAAAAVGCAVDDEPLRQAALGLPAAVEAAMARLQFSAALEAAMRVVTQANQHVEATAPWKLAKQPDVAPRLHAVLNTLAEVLRIVAIMLDPFMPSVAAEIWRQLGCAGTPRRFADAAAWGRLPAGQPLGASRILFPKAETAGR
jgi:methionyl-tRNA synthetase